MELPVFKMINVANLYFFQCRIKKNVHFVILPNCLELQHKFFMLEY